jgi:MFS family permease
MGAGVLLNLACVAVALSGVELHHFGIALFLLGVGWNFLFTGSTTLSLQAYRPEEKDRAQAAINFFVFATMALTSFASGALVTTQGWTLLNYGSLAPIALTGMAVLWLAMGRKTPPEQLRRFALAALRAGRGTPPVRRGGLHGGPGLGRARSMTRNCMNAIVFIAIGA